MSGDNEFFADRSSFSALGATGRAIGMFSRSARIPVYVTVAALIALSWTLFASMAERVAFSVPGATLGPGGDLARWLPDLPLPAALSGFAALCLSPAPAAGGAGIVAAASAMWLLMSMAMMLPSALPMIRTYCEIADTAARKGEHAVHPLVLVGGYLTVWIVLSVLFGIVWSLAGGLLAPNGIFAPLSTIPAATILAVAGLYQFSAMKEACLTKCRNPFATLFAGWSMRPAAIFRLGVRQGLWCVGCCWALMLVMLAVGTMNLLWMALLAILAITEKTGRGRVVPRISGSILLVWSAALLLLSV